MAFRRRTFRPRRHRFRNMRSPLAHVRRTWIQSLLLDPCDPQVIPLCLPEEAQCCTTRWEQVIVDNQVLEDKFSDRASAVRIIGDVLIGWDVTSGLTPTEYYEHLASAAGDLYVQLIKRPIDKDGNTELPPEIWDTASVIEGFSESKAMKTWWHHWNAYDNFKVVVGQPFSQSSAIQTFGVAPRLHICGTNTTACITPDQLTSGSGYTWETQLGHSDGVQLDAECVACGELDLSQTGAVSDYAQLKAPTAWRFHFDIKKRISLREDEQLALDFQFRSLYSTIFNNGSIVMQSGGIKTLMQF